MALELPKIIKGKLSIPMFMVLSAAGFAAQFVGSWAYRDHKSVNDRIAVLERGDRVTAVEQGEQRLTNSTQQRSDMGDFRYKELISAIDDVKANQVRQEASQLRLEKKLDDWMIHMTPTRTAEGPVFP